MKVLHSASPEVLDFIKALGLDVKGLQDVTLNIHVGNVVAVTATYQVEVWVSDLKKASEVIKQYQLIELPKKTVNYTL